MAYPIVNFEREDHDKPVIASGFWCAIVHSFRQTQIGRQIFELPT